MAFLPQKNKLEFFPFYCAVKQMKFHYMSVLRKKLKIKIDIRI